MRRGRGDGTFLGQQHVARGLHTISGAVADFDRDGRPDLAFSATCAAYREPDVPGWFFVDCRAGAPLASAL